MVFLLPIATFFSEFVDSHGFSPSGFSTLKSCVSVLFVFPIVLLSRSLRPSFPQVNGCGQLLFSTNWYQFQECSN